MLTINIASKDPKDIELVNNYWKRNSDGEFSIPVKDFFPFKNLKGPTMLVDYMQAVANVYVKDYLCHGCHKPVIFTSRTDYAESISLRTGKVKKTKLCMECKSFSNLFGYDEYKSGNITKEKLIALNEYLEKETSKALALKYDFKNTPEAIKLILSCFPNLQEYTRTNEDISVKSFSAANIAKILPYYSGVLSILAKLKQEGIISIYPRASKKSAILIPEEESTSLVGYLPYRVSYIFAKGPIDQYIRPNTFSLSDNQDKELISCMYELWTYISISECLAYTQASFREFEDTDYSLTSIASKEDLLIGAFKQSLEYLSVSEIWGAIESTINEYVQSLNYHLSENEIDDFFMEILEKYIRNATHQNETERKTIIRKKPLSTLTKGFYDRYFIDENTPAREIRKKLLAKETTQEDPKMISNQDDLSVNDKARYVMEQALERDVARVVFETLADDARDGKSVRSIIGRFYDLFT